MKFIRRGKAVVRHQEETPPEKETPGEYDEHPLAPDALIGTLIITKIRLRFAAPALVAASFSFPGSAWRGLLGRALQQTSCSHPGRRCPQCPDSTTCIYHALFEETREDSLRHHAPPRPYVLSPLPMQAGHCGVELTLLGRTGREEDLRPLLEQITAAAPVMAELGLATDTGKERQCFVAMEAWHL